MIIPRFSLFSLLLVGILGAGFGSGESRCDRLFHLPDTQVGQLLPSRLLRRDCTLVRDTDTSAILLLHAHCSSQLDPLCSPYYLNSSIASTFHTQNLISYRIHNSVTFYCHTLCPSFSDTFRPPYFKHHKFNSKKTVNVKFLPRQLHHCGWHRRTCRFVVCILRSVAECEL